MSKSKSIWTSIAGVLTSILAFLGIVSCCGMPIIAGVLSVLGIGASQLSFFAEYRWWFIALSVICIAWGFFQVYGKKKSCCCGCDGEGTDNSKKSPKQTVAKVFLWIGTLLTAFVIIYNLVQPSQSTSCCPSENIQPAQSGCCGTTEDDESVVEFENKSSAPSCCGTQEAVEQNNDCCTQN